VLRGNHPARVDDKGRIKIPNGFLQLWDANYASEVFVTSLSGENVRVYPMEVWIELERKLQAIPGTHPSKARFLDRVHFFGQTTTRDRQGRLLIPAPLRLLGDLESRTLLEEAGERAVYRRRRPRPGRVWNLIGHAADGDKDRSAMEQWDEHGIRIDL
jgi:MraZ protein